MNMVKLLLKLGWLVSIRSEKILNKRGLGFVSKAVYKIIKMFCMSSIEMICWFKFELLHQYPSPLEDDEKGPVVSLTSFPARINTIWIVLISMFYQTRKPGKILLILTDEEFPHGKESLPKSLQRMEKLGVEIVFVNYNLKPHNKYYYALSTIRDRDVITIDDDLFYWDNTIERLYKLKAEHPDCICANKALQIVKDGDVFCYRRPSPNVCGHSFMAQGVGAVLYPSHFRTDNLFNKEDIMKLCLLNDDNWLKVNEILANIKVCTNGVYPHPMVLLKSQHYALWKKNIPNNRSLNITKNLLEYYDVENSLFEV